MASTCHRLNLLHCKKGRMAGPVYSNMVMRLLRANNDLVDISPSAYTTDLPANVLAFRLMGWLSMVCASVLFVEQYFFRRVQCFQPENFTQPHSTIGEFCWQHGRLKRNITESDHWTTWPKAFMTIEPNWVLQAYVYFMVRFFVFALPHIFWNLNFRASVQSLLKSCVDVLKELEIQWLRYGEKVEGGESDPKDIQTAANHLRALTRDIVQITRHQLPYHRRILSFIQLRMVVDCVCLSLCVIMDFILFRICSQYDSTDLHCTLPNGESIRCVVPMMQLLWQVVVLSLLASCFCLLMISIHSIYLVHYICSSDTTQCFLNQIPYAEVCEDLKIKNITDRKTYKLLSKLMMNNYCIIQPLNFVNSFVKHLEENNDVHVNQRRRDKDEDGHDWEQLVTTEM